MLSPLRKTRQRKPSHFGSYCHSSPTGTSSTESASMGGNGGCNSSGMTNPFTHTLPHQRKRPAPRPAVEEKLACHGRACCLALGHGRHLFGEMTDTSLC